jgi:hypothetical protein
MIKQQKKRAPWEKRIVSPPSPKKKRNALWPWIISGAIAGLLIVLVAITTIVHSPSKSTPLKPHATPTPTSPTQGLENYLYQLANNSHPNGTITTSTYNPNAKSEIILDILSGQLDNATAIANIQYDCFVIQRAIWKSNILLTTVTVNINAPGMDQQGVYNITKVGECDLKAQTETSFNWETLTPQQAWMTYDKIWMNPLLNK